MNRHTIADRHLNDITAVSLHDLGRRLHALIELNRQHPSHPDGYPNRTPGASPPTSRPTTRTDDTDDGQVTLTTVEAAATTRHHDELATAERRCLDHLELAANALHQALHQLDLVDRLRNDHTNLNPEPGCWAMARIGAWEPTHRTTDLADILPTPLDEPRPLGRWAYDFARRQGRLPTRQECELHRAGKKVMVAA